MQYDLKFFFSAVNGRKNNDKTESTLQFFFCEIVQLKIYSGKKVSQEVKSS